MKNLLIGFLLCGMALSQVTAHPMPSQILRAKTATVITLSYPGETPTASIALAIQRQAEGQFEKWGRFQIVNRVGHSSDWLKPDLTIMISVAGNGAQADLFVYGPDGPPKDDTKDRLWTEASYGSNALVNVIKELKKSIATEDKLAAR